MPADFKVARVTLMYKNNGSTSECSKSPTHIMHYSHSETPGKLIQSKLLEYLSDHEFTTV